MTPSNNVKGFDGVSNIVRFNSAYYATSVLALAATTLILWIQVLPWWIRAATLCGVISLVFWTCSSLLVSWYVYDVAGVMRWEWLRDRLHLTSSRWANIHAGLDQSTTPLRGLFPGSQGVVIDIYDPETMTEPSIARARQLYPATEPFQSGQAQNLPLQDKDCDTIFLLFAAHEVRALDDRIRLLRETSRALDEQGQVVMVEHLRDLPNFLAFGPGFLHFYSGRSWRESIRQAGLQIEKQLRLTPFVRCFVLRKGDDEAK